MTRIESKHRSRFAAKLRYYRWVASYGFTVTEKNAMARKFAKRDMEEGT